VQLAYAIGVAQPVGVFVNTFGTGRISEEVLERYVLQNFDMRPKALIEELNLLAPQYYQTAAYGHFGRAELNWEKTTRAKKMADDLSKPSAVAARNGNGNGHKNGTVVSLGKALSGKGASKGKKGKKGALGARA
jgi:S-adenosylmethionine synthetase